MKPMEFDSELFSNSLKDLERSSLEDDPKDMFKIVKKLESGENSLEESIELYKKGATLCAECSKLLENAKLTIKTIADVEVENND